VLLVDHVKSAYGRIEALHGVNLEVAAREVVALIGGNGAGKSTLMRVISGVQPMSGGSLRFDGKTIETLPAHRRVALGITQVPEGRQIFTSLGVEDNLRLGAWLRPAQDAARELDYVYGLFPVLREKCGLAAGALSGGQQQMLAIARALMAKPRLLLLDEPSMGLAPKLVDEVLAVIAALKRDGLTILLVEQNAQAALAIADRAYVLETGRITASGTAVEIRHDPRVCEAYLGI